MRPYRAKRKDNGEWVIGGFWERDKQSFIIETAATPLHKYLPIKYIRLVEVHPSTVGQQIGLQDKTEKHELYAGDRIVVGHDRGIITWDEYGLAWGIELDDEGGFQEFCSFYTDKNMSNIEYLGSIHTEPQNGKEEKNK